MINDPIYIFRFVAVWLHSKAKHINTKRNTRVVICLLYGIIGSFCGYWCSWADQLRDGFCIPNAYTPGLERKTGAFLAIGVSLYAIIPSIVVTLLNCLIVFRLVQRRRRSTSLQCSPVMQNKHRRRTATLLSISIAFVILVTPNATAHVLNFVSKTRLSYFESTQPQMVVLREVANILEQLNYTINFFLYVCVNERYRRYIGELIFRRYYHVV